MTSNAGFDDSSGLLFITLVGISAAVGVATTHSLGIDGPWAFRLLVEAGIALVVFVVSHNVLVVLNPYNARELLMGEE